VVESEDKRAARLNMISHFLSMVPYEQMEPPLVHIPHRPPASDYERPPRELNRPVPDHAARISELAAAAKGKKKG